MKADHSNHTRQQLGEYWLEAVRLRNKLAVGDLLHAEITSLYMITGYPLYTVSALRMCDEIIDKYRIEGLTARLTR